MCFIQKLLVEEKQYYEKEAARENGLNPVDKDEGFKEDPKPQNPRPAPKSETSDVSAARAHAPVVHHPEHHQHDTDAQHAAYSQQYPLEERCTMEGTLS